MGHSLLMPGLVDPYVHLNELGRLEAGKGFATGTAICSRRRHYHVDRYAIELVSGYNHSFSL